MQSSTSVHATFECTLERAFKTPILGDATKFLIGYLIIPPIVGFSDDETWGKKGGSRIPLSAKNFISKGGPVGLDVIYERDENQYWKWGVSDFRQYSMGFTKFQGELFFRENKDGHIDVKWIYTLFSNSMMAYPFHWFFTKVFWRGQMKIGIKNMKRFAESDHPFLYK